MSKQENVYEFCIKWTKRKNIKIGFNRRRLEKLCLAFMCINSMQKIDRSKWNSCRHKSLKQKRHKIIFEESHPSEYCCSKNIQRVNYPFEVLVKPYIHKLRSILRWPGTKDRISRDEPVGVSNAGNSLRARSSAKWSNWLS